MAQIAQGILDEIIRRVVAVAHPERIILFGSAARETIGPHSLEAQSATDGECKTIMALFADLKEVKELLEELV